MGLSTPMPLQARKAKSTRRSADFPPRISSGYLVRDAHRAFQRLLERRIAPYGVSRGQWYFLRVLWTNDGLSQRELSARVGMMEPTTVIALRSMEKTGLIRRVRSGDDRRKVRVLLTAKAKRLRDELLGVARTITDEAEEGIAARDLASFRRVVARMTANLDRIER
jgi:DNA-binding MarR family transcriptional regulator